MEIKDEHRFGRPVSVIIPENVDIMHDMILENLQIGLVSFCGISKMNTVEYDYLVLTVAGDVRLGQASSLSYATGCSDSGRQHSLKCARGKRSRPVCPVVQQEEIESIPASTVFSVEIMLTPEQRVKLVLLYGDNRKTT
ncbi:hypothetical protein ANN_22532 [Periplaneta americana]|uniref:Per a allergen n=1 Tax=Periplaneta americana TaxID=6978 RepID=A0ABQ8S8E0_PERAM|nr:hypothetical protein ANN_22532 [Periplaneta americana]